MDIIISNQSDEPIYRQILRQIKAAIMSGELKEGDTLPSIRTLAVQLKISSITTKRAYDELESEGFIYSQVGRGSFVSAQNTQLIYESQLRLVEEKLSEAHDAAKSINLPKSELHELLDIICDDNIGG